MVQIISDKQSKFQEWLSGVLDRMDEFDITQAVLVVHTTSPDSPQFIEFINCDTDDMFYMGGVLQKEAIKHEMAVYFGLEDEDWEEDDIGEV